MKRLIDLLKIYSGGDASAIKYSDCDIINERIAANIGFVPKSVIISTLPYYTRFCNEPKTVSAYALAYDYHILIKNIGEIILPKAKKMFPQNNFAFFGDHSPINEKNAAAKAGLGIIGMHSLLITPNHSSYVFLFELITDIECHNVARKIEYCENCGKCKEACPSFLSSRGDCLSAITQKKGELSDDEKLLIKNNNSVWGCDICQTVCPHTVNAITNGSIYTELKWFNNNVISCPDAVSVNNVDDFKMRAYSWRGKNTILRNIDLLEEIQG